MNFLNETSVRSVLESIFPVAQICGLQRIRYYHYAAAEQKLVSVESVGHEESLASQFRQGYIVKKWSADNTSDSFLALIHGKPLVLELRREDGISLPSEQDHGLKCVPLRQDQCKDFLAGHKSDMWIDFPLFVGGKAVGKLSCDSRQQEITSEMPTQITRFWDVAQGVGPVLECLYLRELAPRSLLTGQPLDFAGLPTSMTPVRPAVIPEQVHTDITGCSSAQELFAYCTETLPRQLFGCRFASLFVTSKDHSGQTKLVLRKTSFQQFKAFEHSAYYDLNEAGLTPWVARRGVSLRIQDLANQEATNAALKRYDPDLAWSNKYQDSDNHSSFLAVPITDENREVFAVLRLTQKIGEGVWFTEQDERLMNLIAVNLIRPRLKALLTEAMPIVEIRKLAVMGVRDSVSRLDLSKEVCTSLKEQFCQCAGRTAFVINLLEEQTASQTPCASIKPEFLGGDLPCHLVHNQSIQLEGTITGLALCKETKHAIRIHDFEASGVKGIIDKCWPKAVCALACRISFAEADYGAIVVLSDKYDILDEPKAKFLELLCLEAGGIYASRTLESISFSEIGIGHDCRGPLKAAEWLLDELQADLYFDEPKQKSRFQQVRDLNKFALRLLSFYFQEFPPNPKVVRERLIRDTGVADVLMTTITAAELDGSVFGKVSCTIPPELKADLYPEPINAIVYNLLKNAITAICREAEFGVILGAALHDGWLDITVSNQCRGRSATQINDAFAFDPLKVLHGETRPEGTKVPKGLYLCRQISRFYRLDSRTASLRALDLPDGGCQITLRVPV